MSVIVGRVAETATPTAVFWVFAFVGERVRIGGAVSRGRPLRQVFVFQFNAPFIALSKLYDVRAAAYGGPKTLRDWVVAIKREMCATGKGPLWAAARTALIGKTVVDVGRAGQCTQGHSLRSPGPYGKFSCFNSMLRLSHNSNYTP